MDTAESELIEALIAYYRLNPQVPVRLDLRRPVQAGGTPRGSILSQLGELIKTRAAEVEAAELLRSYTRPRRHSKLATVVARS